MNYIETSDGFCWHNAVECGIRVAVRVLFDLPRLYSCGCGVLFGMSLYPD
jgi:hypothetical protein